MNNEKPLLEKEEAKRIYAEELKEYGIENPTFHESSGSAGGSIVKRAIGIWIKEKGNAAAIKYLLAQGFRKERRVKDGYASSALYSRHNNGQGYLIRMELEVMI